MDDQATQAIRTPVTFKNDDKFAIWSQQFGDVLEQLRHMWMGERREYNESSRKHEWVKDKDSKAIMNDAGIDFVLSSLHSFANKSMTMSNLSRDEAYVIVRQRSIAVVDTLVLEHERYGLRHQQLLEVGTTICQIYLSTALRAVGGGERRFLGTSGIVQEVHQALEKRGFGPKLFG